MRAWAQKNWVSGIVLNKALHQLLGPGQISARGVINVILRPGEAATLVSFQSRKRPLNTSDRQGYGCPSKLRTASESDNG